MTSAAIFVPTPTITTPRSWFADEKSRTRKATYTVVEATTETEGQSVVLTCSHSKNSKRFTAYLQPVKTGVKGTDFTVESFMVFSGKAVAAEPVARFSAKALDAFTAQAIEKVSQMVQSDAAVADFFIPESGASEKFLR